MAKLIEPLAPNVPIVDPETGNPTPYFARLLRDISDARVAESIIEAMGGDPDEDQVVTWDDAAGDLAFKPASDVLDMINDVHGSILYRDSADWQALAPGTSGQVLQTNGASADPSWVTPSSGGGSATWTLVDQSGAAITGNTVTVTIASPGVFTLTAHGFPANAPVVLTTTGALPTGLTAGTVYYVRNPAANTFELSATSGGASINTSGTQSGTHTVTKAYTWAFSTNTTTVDITGLAGASEVLIACFGITMSSSDVPVVRVSTDNGANYFATSGQYVRVAASGAPTNSTNGASFWNATATAARYGTVRIQGLNVSGSPKIFMAHPNDSTPGGFFVADNFNDVDAIRIITNAGANMTGGVIYVLKR